MMSTCKHRWLTIPGTNDYVCAYCALIKTDDGRLVVIKGVTR